MKSRAVLGYIPFPVARNKVTKSTNDEEMEKKGKGKSKSSA